MDELTLDEALEELVSAEEFLDYFQVAYDPHVVHVNRLHILQRYHDYIGQAAPLPADEAAQRTLYTALLTRAYQDFVASDALTEKVFKVFHMHEPQTAFVPLTAITMGQRDESAPAPQAVGCGCGSSGGGSCHSAAQG